MKPDKLRMAVYFDLYGELLTEKQRECLDLYCNQDYTLAEIAELQGTSRQSVYDAISRAEAQLSRFEAVTHSLRRETVCQQAAKNLRSLAEENPSLAEALTAIADRLAE